MEVPRLKGKEFLVFSFLLPGGRGSLQSGRTGEVSSLVGLGTGGWFHPLPRGTRQAGRKGK